MRRRWAALLRYWHTLRHLRAGQISGRLWFRLARPALPGPVGRVRVRAAHGPWQAAAARLPSMQGPLAFTFLHQAGTLAAQGGWNDPAHDKLWLYNLHYFDDLNAAGAHARAAWHAALMQRWVADNPPAAGNGWEPYPTSLRIVNWIKWTRSGHVLPAACRDSLFQQARWLARRLEIHLLGNHLFANAKALVFAGLYFDGPEAARWLRTGLALVQRELPEQVLADGANIERSPMYHAIFLDDLLDLINAARHWGGVARATLDGWAGTASAMLDWQEGMRHPDGEIALFNDAAFDVAPASAVLRAYAARLGLEAPAQPGGLRCFGASGYVRLARARACALLDVAPVGPDYLPGHAHADTLSFELSIDGQRVIVNGGTSCYGLSATRQAERGTRAHSTVEVDGQDSSEVWAGFRVARRARPFGLQCSRADAATLTVRCSHDGYMRLAGAPVHTRQWSMTAQALVVHDRIEGGRGQRAVARYLLHPDLLPEPAGPGVWLCRLANGASVRLAVRGGQARLGQAHYAPRFGQRQRCACLEIALEKGAACLDIGWGADAT